MVMLTNLASVVRRSGLPTVEVDGWRTRGVRGRGLVRVESIIAHHTATPAHVAGDYPSLRIVRDGRSDLAGPLSHLGLGRSGTVYVIAAGLCNHTGRTFRSWQGNSYAIGIEAEHPGGDAAWHSRQYDAYVRLCAALAEEYGVPSARVLGHKEIAAPAGRKPDPTFPMGAFRTRVNALLEDDMPYLDWPKRDRAALANDVATAILKKETANGSTVQNNINKAGNTKEIAAEIHRLMREDSQ